MLIRRETPEDRAAVHAVHADAFRRAPEDPEPVEARLVDDLRADGDLIGALSLVAIRDGEVVGHVCGSPARLGTDTTAAVGLGPLGVRRNHHRTGVGSALVHTILGAADALGYGLVVLLGSPDYYHRFGFVLATKFGVVPPDPAWVPHFQVRSLTAYQPSQTGDFRYAPAFERLRPP